MGATFIITLREGFEAALLLGIVYTYLQKVGGERHYRWVTLGAVLGALGSVLVGVGVTFASGPLLDLGPDLVGAAVIFIAVIVLTWHGWWMSQHARSIKGDVQRRIDEAQASRRLWVIGAIAFTGVFREGAEMVLFLWGLVTQAGVSGLGGIVGGTLGLMSAGGLGWAIFRGGRHVSLRKFFAGTTCLLVLVAAGLFSTGIATLEGLGFLPSTPIAWDTSFLLGDHSSVAGFLGGLIGYRARPSVLEVAAYLGYLAVSTALIFRRTTPATTAGTPHEPKRILSAS